MVRPDHAEVTPIERRDGNDPQTLRRYDNGRVHRPERKIPVLGHELSDAQPVSGLNWICCEIPRRKIAQEANLGLDTKAALEEISHLGNDELRNDERPGMRKQKV